MPRFGSSRSRARLLALVAAVALTVAGLGTAEAATAAPPPPVPASPNLGPNVIVFDPTMPQSEIQATVDASQHSRSTTRWVRSATRSCSSPARTAPPPAPLIFQVGYYTEVAGLGQSPSDVTINGQVDVYNRCLTADNCIALDNFWRSMSNLTINPVGGSGCRANTEFWAVSQASPLRRVNVTGNADVHGLLHRRPAVRQRRLHRRLEDQRHRQRFAAAVPGPQQQHRRRGRTASGTRSSPACRGARAVLPDAAVHDARDDRPVSREKPYLYVDGEGRVQRVRPGGAAPTPPVRPGRTARRRVTRSR